MSELMIASLAIAAASALASTLLFWIRSGRKIRALEQNLQHCSEALCQMVEIQMTEHQKIERNFREFEERFLNLAAPEGDSTRPIDRRHQVLTMSRNGFALDEIVKRLNIPKGEAELIMNLRRYTGAAEPNAEGTNGDPRKYAQA